MHICCYFVREWVQSNQSSIEGKSRKPRRSLASHGIYIVIKQWSVGTLSSWCARIVFLCGRGAVQKAHVTGDECLGVSWQRVADTRKQSACSAERGGRQRWITARCRVGRVYPRVHLIRGAEVHKACAARVADDTAEAFWAPVSDSYAFWVMSVWQSYIVLRTLEPLERVGPAGAALVLLGAPHEGKMAAWNRHHHFSMLMDENAKNKCKYLLVSVPPCYSILSHCWLQHY